MNDKQQKKLVTTISEISQLHPVINACLCEIRGKIAKFEQDVPSNEVKTRGGYWSLVAYMDGLIRLRLMIEQNFQFVETLGVLAITRYVFELSVWMRSLSHDNNYGLTYYFQIMQKQIKYYQDLIKKANSEIGLLKLIDEEESARIKALALEHPSNSDSSNLKLVQDRFALIQKETDRKARREAYPAVPGSSTCSEATDLIW